jgi:cytochrome c553
MKLSLLTSVAILGLLWACGVAGAAGDAQAGKAKTAGCAGCHGVNGEGVGPFPPLAGWSETQIVDALQELKSGKLIDPVMNPMATKLGDQDMADIGAYCASLKTRSARRSRNDGCGAAFEPIACLAMPASRENRSISQRRKYALRTAARRPAQYRRRSKQASGRFSSARRAAPP